MIHYYTTGPTSPSPSSWPGGKGQTTCGWAARKVRIDRCCSFAKIARTQSWMLKNPGRLFIIVHFNNPLSSEVGTCLALLHVPPQSSSVPSPLWTIMPAPNTITLITTMRWAPQAECKESSHAILRNLCHISITSLSPSPPPSLPPHHIIDNTITSTIYTIITISHAILRNLCHISITKSTTTTIDITTPSPPPFTPSSPSPTLQ